MSDTPIADHALLSDRHSCALVSTAGSVEWLSFPRFDSPSMFGRLLGAAAGYWQIKPASEWRSSRRYVDRTLVLETTFSTDTGTVVLTDLLAVGPNNAGHRLGRDVPHLLVRRVECTAGEVELEVAYEPRPEYGLVVPLLSAVDGGVTARGGADWLVLTTPLELEISKARGCGRTTLQTGASLHFALHRSTLEQTPARIWSQDELEAQVDNTVSAWQSWSDLHQAPRRTPPDRQTGSAVRAEQPHAVTPLRISHRAWAAGLPATRPHPARQAPARNDQRPDRGDPARSRLPRPGRIPQGVQAGNRPQPQRVPGRVRAATSLVVTPVSSSGVRAMRWGR
jgi:GH15 family glucan-1,4-alpha-glucosidase